MSVEEQPPSGPKGFIGIRRVVVSADEVADAIAYIASPAAGSTTGTWLAVDGGMAKLQLRPRN
jgi:NAD(P)-dependent dehydrogenase (short-subunit alcohol dehydrogenase family)